jgi:hypothetical protein
MTAGVRSGIGLDRSNCLTEDLFYSAIQQKMENMEFLKAMLAKMKDRMLAKMDTNMKSMQQ